MGIHLYLVNFHTFGTLDHPKGLNNFPSMVFLSSTLWVDVWNMIYPPLTQNESGTRRNGRIKGIKGPLNHAMFRLLFAISSVPQTDR